MIALPGPSVLLTVAHSISFGWKRGIITVAGATMGIAVQLTIAAIGLTSLLNVVAQAFEWLRWVGAVYLIYLGIKQWRSANDPLELNLYCSISTSIYQHSNSYWISICHHCANIFSDNFYRNIGLGFGIWSSLLSRHPASRVAPLSLLVPVFGLLTAGIVLGEQLTPVQWWGCLLVIGGLLVSTFGAQAITWLNLLPLMLL